MAEVREIEKLIVTYQNELRINVHTRQLNDYLSIGNEIHNDFELNWKIRFDMFEEKYKKNITTRKVFLKEYNNEKFANESNKVNQTKLKPNNRMKMLQNQEKLVAINERIEEAANYRNELKVLEKKDEERLIKTKCTLIDNIKKDLDRNSKKNMNKLNDLLQAEKNKLLINKNKETTVLTKQVNLHVSDIKRIQNQLCNLYIKKASTSDEMARTKDRQRQTNLVLSSFKNIIKNHSNITDNKTREIALALLNCGSKNISLNVSIDSTNSKELSMKKSSIALKYIIDNFSIIKFSISSDDLTKKIVNVPEDYNFRNDNNLKKKIKKLLDKRRHQEDFVISPTAYYDNNLNEICSAEDYKDLLPKIGK